MHGSKGTRKSVVHEHNQRIQTAPMEDKHARNKKHNRDTTECANIAAKFILAESKQLMANNVLANQRLQEYRARPEQHLGDTGIVAPVLAHAAHSAEDRNARLCMFVRSPLQFFHRNFIENLRNNGQRVNPLDVWGKVKELWSEKSAEELAEYEARFQDLSRLRKSAKTAEKHRAKLQALQAGLASGSASACVDIVSSPAAPPSSPWVDEKSRTSSLNVDIDRNLREGKIVVLGVDSTLEDVERRFGGRRMIRVKVSVNVVRRQQRSKSAHIAD